MSKSTRSTQDSQQSKSQSSSQKASVESSAAPLTSQAVPLQSALTDPLGASPEQVVQLQQQYGNKAVQRLIQRAQSAKAEHDAEVGAAGGEVSGNLQSQIDSARGGGQPLDQNVGKHMGGALGADFSGVKVHTDSKSDSINRSLSAKAFTTGSDIFFSEGTYNPGTHSGQELLAHELTHVVQQGGSQSNTVQTKLTVGSASDKYEQEADAVAARVMAHGSVYNGAQQADSDPRQIHRSPSRIQRGFFDTLRSLFGGNKKESEISGPTKGKDESGATAQYDQGDLGKSLLRPVVTTYDPLYDTTCKNVNQNWAQKTGSEGGKKNIRESDTPAWIQKKYPELVGKQKGRFGRIQDSPSGFFRAPSGVEVNEFMLNLESRAWMLRVVNKWLRPNEIDFLTAVLAYRKGATKDAFMAIFRLYVADDGDESIHVDQGMKEKLKEMAVAIDPTAGQAQAYKSPFG